MFHAQADLGVSDLFLIWLKALWWRQEAAATEESNTTPKEEEKAKYDIKRTISSCKMRLYTHTHDLGSVQQDKIITFSIRVINWV